MLLKVNRFRKKDFVWKSAYDQYAINDEMVQLALIDNSMMLK